MDEKVVNEDYGSWKPNKREREVRRRVYERWNDMRSDPLRKAAETDWDNADKQYTMYVPEIDPEDWRSHLELPDAFAAIQVHMQETIERRSRPSIQAVEGSDEPKEQFSNALLNHNMDVTGFDYEYFKAKLAAAIRGTAFMKNYYREEKRTVRDPVDVDKEGNLVYVEREITDFDDDYTQWIDNEWVYVDPGADSIDTASDCIEREVMPIEKFHLKYDKKRGFKNTEYVQAGGDTGRVKYFQPPTDLMADEVEVLHYSNRDTDDYQVVANNIVINDGPLPTKHKELPFAVVYHIRVPGRFFGLGVPKIVSYLSEERKAIRRLNLDRQKLQIGGMFLTSSSFDLDDEELQARPFGLIEVENNGQPLNSVIQRVDVGDVPSSYFRTEEILLEDIRRTTGIDDRIQGVQTGGTATEAAILKESAMKRINMISSLSEMDTMTRICRLKWSNIQFFYKAPRVEQIIGPNNEVTERVKPRRISVNGKRFTLRKAPGSDKQELNVEEIDGKSSFVLNKTAARFMSEDMDVSMTYTVHTPVSRAIKQAKTTEMITTISSSPQLLAQMDAKKALKRYIEINDEDPKAWMIDPNTKEEMESLAELENKVMSDGEVLKGTTGATIEHTMVHLSFTETAEYQALPKVTQDIIMNHILEEHDKNPMTGSSADLLGAAGMGATGPQSTVQGGPAPSIQANVPRQMQMADMTPANNNPRPE